MELQDSLARSEVSAAPFEQLPPLSQALRAFSSCSREQRRVVAPLATGQRTENSLSAQDKRIMLKISMGGTPDWGSSGNRDMASIGNHSVCIGVIPL